jgi:EAL and modified HD-GYP domain-containing signal transduction protein
MVAQAFIARQPIVDRAGQLYGYELLFRHAENADSALIGSELEAGIQVMANTLFDMGTHWLLEGKLAYVNMGPETLLSPTTTLLPPEKIVIELTDKVLPTPEVRARIDELAGQGYRFSMDALEVGSPREELASRAAYIKLNARGLSPDVLAEQARHMRAYPAKLIAERVEDQDMYRQCQAIGFDFFQGYYFARPQTMTARVINPSHAVVLQLMEKVRANAHLGEIELLFKKDVALTFKLLRYINSAGFGLSCEVQSIRHAVSILGMQPLYRWLTLLLATAGGGEVNAALVRTAITRGRLCELLGGYIMDKADRDNLFIAGVFSMLDALLETPMDSILERLVIPESIADALHDRSGIYGPVLRLAEACESGDYGKIEMMALSLMLTPEQVNASHLQAIAWVEQLGLD